MSPSPRAPLVSPSLRTLQVGPSPQAPPVSPTGTPRTPGGSQKKPVLGKVKSKAKKWMHLLHHKKKPAHEEMMMWTPRIGPSLDDNYGTGPSLQNAEEHLGTPSTALHPPSCMYVCQNYHDSVVQLKRHHLSIYLILQLKQDTSDSNIISLR